MVGKRTKPYFVILFVLSSFAGTAQFSLSIGGGGSKSISQSTGSTVISLQPKLKVSEKARVGLDALFGLNRKQAFLLDVDFKSPEKKFYWGMGTGAITNSSSNFLLAPRVGFRGSFDISSSLLFNPNRRSGGHFIVRIMYVFGSKD